MTKHIELFEGSLKDLEELTGKYFKAIRNKEGKLVKINTTIGYNIISEARMNLESQAERAGADGIVNVTYWNEQLDGRRIFIHGSGYLVREVTTDTEKTKDTVPFSTQ